MASMGSFRPAAIWSTVRPRARSIPWAAISARPNINLFAVNFPSTFFVDISISQSTLARGPHTSVSLSSNVSKGPCMSHQATARHVPEMSSASGEGCSVGLLQCTHHATTQTPGSNRSGTVRNLGDASNNGNVFATAFTEPASNASRLSCVSMAWMNRTKHRDQPTPHSSFSQNRSMMAFPLFLIWPKRSAVVLPSKTKIIIMKSKIPETDVKQPTPNIVPW
mmetsp:Transcript_5002/g.11922  ORF Transcript_5002/g.11922 Transcript_5002/m.11922 type:complete len:222 (+) Transcript_5002:113-778(+)